MKTPREPIHIPSIRGRIAERLQRAKPRNLEEMEFLAEDGMEVVLRSPDERSIVALACLILEQFREHGGSRAPKRPLEQILKRTLATLGPKDVMDLEIEAYELLLWIGSAIDKDWHVERVEEQTRPEDDKGPVALINWAIATRNDLTIDYYSRNRGELSTRKISPISFEAETYLHAYCHLRRDERIFRLSRIATIHPVGGGKAPGKKPKAASPAEEDAAQMSLLK